MPNTMGITMRRPAFILAAALCAGAAAAGEAQVVAGAAAAQGPAFRIEATVRHADTGWDHYADAWRVEGPDGAVYGVRELLHPHVEEQPFTRSLSGVTVPEGIATVTLRARDSVHGWGAATVSIPLPGR